MRAPMLPDRVHAIIMPVALSLGFTCVFAAPSGDTTTWNGGLGDWSEAVNWSNGEPTSTTDAVVPIGTVVVTQPGETCRRLDIAVGNLPVVRISSGTLDVVETIQIGVDELGTIQHMSGAVTANELVIGGPDSGGAYAMTAGTLTLGSANLASTDASGLLSISQNATCTISGSLNIASACDLAIGGTATLTVGTTQADGVTVDGAFSFTGTPTVTFAKFTMTPDATLSETLVSPVHGVIEVTGPAVIDGTLLVVDLQLPDGSYELMRGNPLTGGFDSAMFTSPGWSWRVEGNSLFIDKDSTPVQTTGWSGVKDRYRL